jgi:hypothetical protein
VLCAWVPVIVPRSLRGRPSQVKGAFGVADAMPLRGTLDLRASTAPSGQRCGQAQSPAPHNARHHHRHQRSRPYQLLHGPVSGPILGPDAYQPHPENSEKQQH